MVLKVRRPTGGQDGDPTPPKYRLSNFLERASSISINTFLRDRALIQYRCTQRHCLLLAVVKYMEQTYIIQKQNSVLQTLFIQEKQAVELVRAIANNDTESAKSFDDWIVECTRNYIEATSVDFALGMIEANGGLRITPKHLNEQSSAGIHHNDTAHRQWTTVEWGVRAGQGGDLHFDSEEHAPFFHSNCAHVDMSKTLAEIQTDIDRMKRRKKKQIYIH